MSAPSPLRPPAVTGADRLLQCAPALLDTTMDQLRTLVLVHQTGTALAAARLLGREQSSVQKQLDTLNRNYRELCGEMLVQKQGRGRDVLFTETGKALVDMARKTLGDWLDEIHERRRRLGGTLTVGTTRYALGFLASAGELVADRFQHRGIELKVLHVRTKDLLDSLRTKQADLVCGSVVTTTGPDPALAEFEIQEWRRSTLSLATNLPPERLPDRPVPFAELPRLPLIVSAAGLIPDFLRGRFGPGYPDRLDIVAEIDNAQYGFELLHSGLVQGCMLVTEGIGEAVADGRLTTAAGLRTIKLVDPDPTVRVLVGVFARRGERAGYTAEHPLNLLWQAFIDNAARWRRDPL